MGFSDATKNYREQWSRRYPPNLAFRVFHLFFLALLGLGSIVLAVARLDSPVVWDFLAVPAIFLLGNLVIYVLHRTALHRHIPGMHYAYQKHTLEHHRYFTQEVYELENPFFTDQIFFPVWFVFLVALVIAPGLALLASVVASANAAWLTLASTNGIYLLYELVHYCSHLPESSWVHQIGFFRMMRRHHRIHHDPALMGGWNFDIIVPIFDPIFGTYRRFP